MDIRKFTQRSVEAIQGAQSIAIEHNNQQVDEEHLLLALLTQEDSLIASLLTRMGKDADAFTEAVRAAVERRPQVTGSGGHKVELLEILSRTCRWALHRCRSLLFDI